ncbi:MAG: single-stranded DNA-binding protein [Sphingobacteriales bacterium]|nr:single-stranded DNA-binding protein [Sphingobacteriales bacterium]
MELTGRITADAKVHSIKDGRKVVRFSIALNDRYKPKGSEEWKQLTTYVNCSWWQRETLAPFLSKGALVELAGRISVSAWKNAAGEAKGSLDFFVSSVKFHGGRAEKKTAANPAAAPAECEAAIDLPF